MPLDKPYDFTADEDAVADEVNANFDALFDWINGGEAMKADGSVAFTGIPSAPATDPTGDNQLTRKAYVDGVSGSQKRKGGVTIVGLDVDGYGTITHGCGFTPLAVICTGKSPVSGGDVPAMVLADSFTSTTFRVRAFNTASEPVFGVVAISWDALAEIA